MDSVASAIRCKARHTYDVRLGVVKGIHSVDIRREGELGIRELSIREISLLERKIRAILPLLRLVSSCRMILIIWRHRSAEADLLLSASRTL